MSERVVATGMSVLTPIGNTLEEFWENCINKKIGYKLYKDSQLFNGEGRIFGKVYPFEVKKYSISDLDQMGRPAKMAVCASIEAINNSFLDINQVNKEKFGVIIGNAISDTPFCEKIFLERDNDKNIFQKGMFSLIALEVAKQFGASADVFVMSTGCTAGIDAVGYAYEAIQRGDLDIAICGGVEAPISNITFASFEAIGALAKGFDMCPESASRPFDKKRNGFVLSEGCGILILESLTHAKKRKANIYGEILGYDSCNNAKHMTDLRDDNSLAHIILNIIRNAGVELSEISYINAHGSSTKQNDLYETNSFKKVFGDISYNMPVSSLKSMIGHPLRAASAIEIVQSLLAITNNAIPPLANYNNRDEECDLYYPTEVEEKEVNYVIKTANGFSGIHSAILLGKFSE